ncbi:MAG: hypothetical protein PHS79_05775 [Patescibacteria group bacterium]|nr:hypothetical protein [Patescibacteria group bacterium]
MVTPEKYAARGINGVVLLEEGTFGSRHTPRKHILHFIAAVDENGEYFTEHCRWVEGVKIDPEKVFNRRGDRRVITQEEYEFLKQSKGLYKSKTEVAPQKSPAATPVSVPARNADLLTATLGERMHSSHPPPQDPDLHKAFPAPDPDDEVLIPKDGSCCA